MSIFTCNGANLFFLCNSQRLNIISIFISYLDDMMLIYMFVV